jgi:hypothetical protein
MYRIIVVLRVTTLHVVQIQSIAIWVQIALLTNQMRYFTKKSVFIEKSAFIAEHVGVVHCTSLTAPPARSLLPLTSPCL